MRKVLIAAIGLLVAQNAACAHGADELGHHWEMPSYRAEMLTQIAIMAGMSVFVLVVLWVKQTCRKRRTQR